ncbi:MAG: glycosyltransferase [Bacteroidetes bacterium]|nr:MAG: glycosyltransferase [Bacteroidota bacterium]
MPERKRITYFHIGLSSFVQKDIEILSRHFDLTVKYIDLSKKHYVIKGLFGQFFYIIARLGKTDLFVSQFGGYHSWLPAIFGKVFRKKSVIVLGGTDTVGFPSIRYGAFYLPMLKKFVKWSYKNSSLLLPVSENLVFTDYSYTSEDYPNQGYKFFCPGINTPYKVIYNGYRSEKWFISDKEALSFVTIGANLNSRFGFKLKGIDLLLDLAKKMPEATFYIVGGDKLEDLPSNVVGIGNMPHNEIPKFLAAKQFYFQLSMSEGFPNALCEAMLSGCIPVVSNVGAMPLIVGDERLILKHKSIEELQSIVHEAIANNGYHSPEYWRNRIADNFSLERRERELVEAINELI